METGWRRGEASEPRRRVQQLGCRGQSGEIPAQRIHAHQHSPARDACLLTRWGGWGLGAEAPASQGEDCGWLCELSLKGAGAPQLAGKESGKMSGPAKETRDFFLVREERELRAPLKGVPEMGASCGYQHGSQRWA